VSDVFLLTDGRLGPIRVVSFEELLLLPLVEKLGGWPVPVLFVSLEESLSGLPSPGAMRLVSLEVVAEGPWPVPVLLPSGEEGQPVRKKSRQEKIPGNRSF
jgi:hypothetical protein